MSDDTTDPEVESLRELEKRAETLMYAAEELERMLEVAGDMQDEGALPEGEKTDETTERIETARDVCQELSVSVTMALAEEGYLVDFDEAPWEFEDDEADGHSLH